MNANAATMTNESKRTNVFFTNDHLLSRVDSKKGPENNRPCRECGTGLTIGCAYMILVATERVTVSSFTF